MQKNHKVIRYLADIDKQTPDPAPSDRRTSLDQRPSPSPVNVRIPNGGESFSPREHSFVKTTFSKGT